MIATLKFTLPEESNEHLLAINASKFYGALWDIDQEARGFLKHGHKFKSADEVLEWLREQIPYELLECVE